jgi:trehalose 6-phosphate phosphatase
VKNLLAPPQREVLEQLAWSNVLLGFDYDGTLAPIVADPERAVLRESTRRRLHEVAELYPCVVISGRAVRDVERRLTGIPLRSVVGNHGLEPWRATEEVRRQVARWRETLAPRVAELAGVVIEDKTYSLALHYRRSRRKKEALAGIVRAVAQLGELRVIGGKQVVNVLPLGAPHKGVALERERDRLGCDTALFVGDDETDEDVFALDRPGRLVTVRVGSARASQASYCLRSQAEMDLLLGRLIELRRRAAEPRRRAR